MSNVGAISNWGALTAAQIQQYEQEGYDVPVEYRQWADSATNIYVTYDDAKTQYQVAGDSDTSASSLSDGATTGDTDEESFNAHNPASVFKAGGVADDKSAQAEESGEKADSESASNKQMTKNLKTKFAALNKDVKKNQSKAKNLTAQKNAKNQEISKDQNELDQTNDEIEEAIQEDQEEQEQQAEQQKAQVPPSKKAAPKTRAVAGNFAGNKAAGAAGNQDVNNTEVPTTPSVVNPQDEKANRTGLGVNSAFSLKLADEDKQTQSPANGKKGQGSKNATAGNEGTDTVATRSAAISQMANFYTTQVAAAMSVSTPIKTAALQQPAAPTGAGQTTAAAVVAPAVAATTRAVTPTNTTNTNASSKVADKQATAEDLTSKITASTTKTTQLTSQINSSNSATSKDYQEISKLINEAKKQAAESQKDSSTGQKVAEKFESVGKTIQTVGGAAIAVGVALVATAWATALGKVLETYGAYASYAGGGLAAISEAVQGKWGACLMTAVEVGAVAAAQATGLIGAGAGGAAGSGAGSAANGAFKIGTQTYNANGELIAGYL